MAEEERHGDEYPRKRSQKIHPIAIANDKTDEAFLRDYLKPRYGVQPNRPTMCLIT